jgi:hypothetical protein
VAPSLSRISSWSRRAQQQQRREQHHRVDRKRSDAPLLAATTAASTSGRGEAEPQASRERLDSMPWTFGAQTNERLLHWDDSAAAQLSRIWLW